MTQSQEVVVSRAQRAVLDTLVQRVEQIESALRSVGIVLPEFDRRVVNDWIALREAEKSGQLEDPRR